MRILAIILVNLIILLGSVAAAQDQTELAALEEKADAATGAARVAALNELAVAVRADDPERSATIASEASSLAADIGDERGQITALKNLGIALYFRGDYAGALEHHQESLAIAEEIGYREGIADALNNIGVLYYVWGDYDLCVDYYERALVIRRELGDRNGLAMGVNNLANVYYSFGKYPEALREFETALAMYEELGERSRLASMFNNIGLVFFAQGELAAALERFEMARAISEEQDDKRGLALSLNNAGMVHEKREDYATALDHYRRSLAVREAIDDQQGATICRYNIGVIHFLRGEYDASLQILDQAVAEAEALGLKEVLRDAHEDLTEYHATLDNHELALEHHREFKRIQDELFDAEATRQIAEVRTRHEVERREREIAALRREQGQQRTIRTITLLSTLLSLIVVLLLYGRTRLLKRANEAIQRENEALELARREQERSAQAELAHVARVATMGELAATFAHEVNQPLTSIVSNAQAARRFLASADPDREEVDGALADVDRQARRAGSIIKRLREMVRRDEPRREELDVNQAVQGVEIFARAEARDKGVHLEFALAPELPIIRGDRVQLQQVILNLVNNGIDAMRDVEPVHERRLQLRTQAAEAGGVTITVQDTGPPVDGETVDSMFDPFFTTKEEGLGMGLSICHNIVAAHGGTISALADPRGGLTVRVDLPAAPDEAEPSPRVKLIREASH